MEPKQINRITEQLLVRGGRVTTTSRDVAEIFDKQHKHVIRAIMTLDCPPEFAGPNFGLCYYSDIQGRRRPMYTMTRDGFTLLAMGFTGPKAMQFKIAYIEAFNQMERQLTGNIPILREELLLARPYWGKIRRYKELGLNNVEISRLMGWSRSTVRVHLRRMEACGLVAPPRNLEKMRRRIAHTQRRMA